MTHSGIEAIQTIYDRLSREDSLYPSPTVNGEFSRLVEMVMGHDGDISELFWDVPTRSLRSKMQSLCSEWESLLEHHWANLLLKNKDPLSLKDLEMFPYMQNYRLLSAWEISLIHQYRKERGLGSARRALFVGSGSLPLSPILMTDAFIEGVDCLDSNEDACKLSRLLISRIGLTENARILHGSAEKFSGYGGYDCIFVAALAGCDAVTKRAIAQSILDSSKPGQTVLFRTAFGYRTFLYPEMQTSWLPDGYAEVTYCNPPSGVVNSCILWSL